MPEKAKCLRTILYNRDGVFVWLANSEFDHLRSLICAKLCPGRLSCDDCADLSRDIAGILFVPDVDDRQLLILRGQCFVVLYCPLAIESKSRKG